MQKLIDNYAASVHLVGVAALTVLKALPQPLDAENIYQYQLIFPSNLPPAGNVAWCAQVYGPSGLTSDPALISANGANNSEVTITVDGSLIGDVVLSATYLSTNNTIAAVAPTLVASKPPLGVTITGIQLTPQIIALPASNVISPNVIATYSDGSSSLRFVAEGSVTAVSSQPAVVSVADPLNWQLLEIGAAQVTFSWSGFQVTSQVTVFDPEAPPLLAPSKSSQGQIALSWASFGPSCQLQSNGNLSDTNGWQSVTNAAVSAGGITSVTLPEEGAQMFYRLQTQP